MLFHAYAYFASFANTLASYRIGFNPVGLEGAPSFVVVSLPFSLNQGKHIASSLNRILLYNIYIMP
jgi:hypothetical protein